MNFSSSGIFASHLCVKMRTMFRECDVTKGGETVFSTSTNSSLDVSVTLQESNGLDS